MRWSKFAVPKCHGGLGYHDLKQFNLALLAKKRVGDGSTISIWRDPWLLDPNEPHIQTEIIDGLDQVVVADLIDGGKWNETLIRCLFNQRDVGLILKIPLPLSVYEDAWFWFLNQKGEYVVKEGYRVSLDMGFEEAGFLAKVKFMVWRILRDVLPCKVNLLRRHVEADE
ncbi:hypothetical protein P3X46_032436 [Hevea brasiliensis]|uniref:Reverse transcriptase zinc-binding domain-containing protein n=1 Tax=Hevea brasiliensis TaxID=3981 RepID=A0ABQ9KDA4_HEVBR|nr:hypothetical protein P3X46_032436 [Hevea brasiliensis]